MKKIKKFGVVILGLSVYVHTIINGINVESAQSTVP